MQSAQYAEEKKVLAKKYKSEDPFWNAFNLLHGNPHIETRSDVKIVRIFTSSTFTGGYNLLTLYFILYLVAISCYKLTYSYACYVPEAINNKTNS